MIYSSVGGSRAYGLELENSDQDIFQVSPKVTVYSESGREDFAHIINLPCDRFIQEVLMQEREGSYVRGVPVHAYSLQLLFPYEFLLSNDLTNWILENRESMVESLKVPIYTAFMERANALAYGAERYYPSWPKRLVYSTHFANVMYNYASGMTFAEAHKCQDDVKDFLISARKMEADKSELLAVNAKALENARSVASFYTSSGDTAILEEFKTMVQAEIAKVNA